MTNPARSLQRAGMSLLVFADSGAASRAAAELIRSTVQSALLARDRAVLGLATGATPEKVYAQLAAFHRQGEMPFRRVVTYNLDEYYPIQPLDPKSYRAYMHRHLFGHVDIAPNHAHMLDGTVPEEFVDEHAAQ